MHGIEINPYAAELAQVVVWIGHLQWLHEHSISDAHRPILDKLQCIENRDAILDFIPAVRIPPSPGTPGEGKGEGPSAKKRSGSGQAAAGKKIPVPASWPEADFIVGNPPFLGGQLMISGPKESKSHKAKEGLGEKYVLRAPVRVRSTPYERFVLLLV